MLKYAPEVYGDRAFSLFYEGYNCAQAVFCAFSEDTGISMSSSARIASSFGGGMGRLREVCGAVSGAFLVLGTLIGYADPAEPALKAAHYKVVQDFARRFREANSSIVCRELLKGVETAPGLVPEARTPEFYRKRPCPELIRQAAVLAAQLIEETEGEE